MLTQIEAHFEIQENPIQYVSDTIEIGNKVISLCDEIENIWNEDVLK